MVVVKVGQLLTHQWHVKLIRVHKNMVARHETRKAVIRLLQLCAARSKEIDKLLGVLLAATGPEPATFAASKNDTIKMVC